jgi:hypoxanthine phosphoribosyltransferase
MVPAQLEFGSDTPISEVADRFFSGRKDAGDGSDFQWVTVLTAKEIDILVRHVAQQINVHYADDAQPVAILGLLSGVFVVAAHLAAYLEIPFTMDFIKASSYVGQEQQSCVRLSPQPNADRFKGRRVLILDELFDTGKTLHTVRLELVKECGLPAEDVATCTLLAKEQPGHAVAPSDLYPRPDIVGIGCVPGWWLVGYGLDDDDCRRGWRHVFCKCFATTSAQKLWGALPQSLRNALIAGPEAVDPETLSIEQVFAFWRSHLRAHLQLLVDRGLVLDGGRYGRAMF